MTINLFNDDCFNVLDELIEKGIQVDSIIVDPPYGTTPLDWDKPLDYKLLTNKLPQILKTTGWLIVFGNSPFYDEFMFKFIDSGKFIYSHEIIWEKTNHSNPLLAKKQPLRKHEKIMILTRTMVGEEYQKTDAYYYIKTLQSDYLSNKSTKELAEIVQNTVGATNHYFTDKKQWALMTETCWNNLKTYMKDNYNVDIKTYNEISELNVKEYNTYNPYTINKTDDIIKLAKKQLSFLGDKFQAKNYVSNQTGYPTSIYVCGWDNIKQHPTQKPIQLLKHLIKLYTNENDTILDFTMGSGSTGVACIETNRNFIGIELNPQYFEIAQNRIKETKDKYDKN